MRFFSCVWARAVGIVGWSGGEWRYRYFLEELEVCGAGRGGAGEAEGRKDGRWVVVVWCGVYRYLYLDLLVV